MNSITYINNDINVLGDYYHKGRPLFYTGPTGSIGPGFSTITNYGNNKLLLSTGTSTFEAVRFDTNNILYHTFQHVGKSSVFTGTFMSQVVLNFEYSLQIHTTANGVYTIAAALYLDDVAIPGSYRSISVKDNNTEYILSNDIIVTIPSGSHKIELKAATTNSSTQIGGVPNIPAPGQSYTSANLRCSRII